MHHETCRKLVLHHFLSSRPGTSFNLNCMPQLDSIRSVHHVSRSVSGTIANVGYGAMLTLHQRRLLVRLTCCPMVASRPK